MELGVETAFRCHYVGRVRAYFAAVMLGNRGTRALRSSNRQPMRRCGPRVRHDDCCDDRQCCNRNKKGTSAMRGGTGGRARILPDLASARRVPDRQFWTRLRHCSVDNSDDDERDQDFGDADNPDASERRSVGWRFRVDSKQALK
jgi:hypothetical protein